jgi:hypothetical protein
MEEIPVLTVILCPFKESRLSTFGKKETLFGILANNKNPKAEVKPIEFLKPLELFEAWKSDENVETVETKESEEKDLFEEGIPTPSFGDFFDETFFKGISNDDPYQPLNNATKMKPPSGTGQQARQCQTVAESHLPTPKSDSSVSHNG